MKRNIAFYSIVFFSRWNSTKSFTAAKLIPEGYNSREFNISDFRVNMKYDFNGLAKNKTSHLWLIRFGKKTSIGIAILHIK